MKKSMNANAIRDLSWLLMVELVKNSIDVISIMVIANSNAYQMLAENITVSVQMDFCYVLTVEHAVFRVTTVLGL